MKEENLHIVITLLIGLLMIIFGFLFMFFPKKEFSEYENRYLEKMPLLNQSSLLNGSYITKLEAYLTDHFPMRDYLMGIKSSFEQTIGKTEINNVYIGEDQFLLEAYQSPSNTKFIINKLNQFYQSLDDAQVFLMLVPTSIAIYEDKLPNYVTDINQIDVMNTYYQQILFSSVDVSKTLLQHKNDISLYYRLDHHWTTYGAYYAYVEYCKQLGIDSIDINRFNIEEVTNQFQGTLYSKTSLYHFIPDIIHTFSLPKNHYEVHYVVENRITNTFYEPSYLNKKDKYSYFLDNNHPLITIINQNIANTKELVVIKDSYANSFVPFLANHYRKIHVIDPRFYKSSISDYINQNQIKDVLFLYNMNTIDQDLGIMSII